MGQSIITFPSVYHAFRARKILTEQSIAIELIPIPRELSAACEGLAAIMEDGVATQAIALLEEKNVVMLKKGIQYPVE